MRLHSKPRSCAPVGVASSHHAVRPIPLRRAAAIKCVQECAEPLQQVGGQKHSNSLWRRTAAQQKIASPRVRPPAHPVVGLLPPEIQRQSVDEVPNLSQHPTSIDASCRPRWTGALFCSRAAFRSCSWGSRRPHCRRQPRRCNQGQRSSLPAPPATRDAEWCSSCGRPASKSEQACACVHD